MHLPAERVLFVPLLALAIWLVFLLVIVVATARERRICGGGGVSFIELLIVTPPGLLGAICLNGLVPPWGRVLWGDVLSVVFIASVVIATALGIRNARPRHPGIPRARVLRRWKRPLLDSNQRPTP